MTLNYLNQGRKIFQVPAGASASRTTVKCRFDRDGQSGLTFNIRDTRGALVLKGAAYKEDSRDRDRHLQPLVAISSRRNAGNTDGARSPS
ncbi:hypothetical protein MCNS_44330 [Mycobacterium conspicuum]|uniref:Uncharacterized protein n=1 Tax=Mycobacterium conspicuum TaxID=44010 RepID=A0A7I7YHS8_9MYCO|nr:hypothetical protein MCNS_44330 [Mycobacterium conspicuum]